MPLRDSSPHLTSPDLTLAGRYVPPSCFRMGVDGAGRTRLMRQFDHRQHGVLFLGEAPGAQEDQREQPFVGPSGRFLRRTICAEGLFRDCPITFANVFPWHPPDNRLSYFTAEYRKRKGEEIKAGFPSLTGLLPGKVLHEEIRDKAPQLLTNLIEVVRPNLIIALGNTPIWALLGKTGIGSLRGSLYYAARFEGQKVLPTFHPAYILRYYADAVSFFADLIKGDREVRYPEIRIPRRHLLLRPTFGEVVHHLTTIRNNASEDNPAAFDIETAFDTITMVSVSGDPTFGMCIPFYDISCPNNSYWTPTEERNIIKLIRGFLETTPITGHYFQYDIDWLFAHFGARPRLVFDTTIASHALWPSMRKSLAFLCSFLINEPRAWKRLRAIKQTDRKRED